MTRTERRARWHWCPGDGVPLVGFAFLEGPPDRERVTGGVFVRADDPRFPALAGFLRRFAGRTVPGEALDELGRLLEPPCADAGEDAEVSRMIAEGCPNG